MSESTNLHLPFLQSGQAQKHVTVNETLLRLDALVQLVAQSGTVDEEPASPDDGQIYILPAGKSGDAWDAMVDGALAYYRDGAWEELSPREGWLAFIMDDGAFAYFDGATWTALPTGGAGPGDAASVAFDPSGLAHIFDTDVQGALEDIDVALGALAGVSDGDKGDIVVSSSGAVWTIDAGAVSYAKLQDVSATARIIGRKTSGAGDAEELSLSDALDFVGSAAHGDLLVRGASGWVRLAAGTSGQYLQTQGAGANPQWAAASGGGGSAALPRSYLAGLTLSNNSSDATNDIDIASGACRDSTDAVDIVLSGVTKRLDAGWAAGEGGGMRNSGASIADGAYHIYAVAKAGGADADIYAHTSTTIATVMTALQAETGGSAYIYARRIGSIVRASGAIRAFVQDGDDFHWLSAAADVAATNPGTSAVSRTLTVPSGIRVKVSIGVYLLHNTGVTQCFGLITDLSANDRTPSATDHNFTATQEDLGGGSSGRDAAALQVFTNTSAQVRSRISQSSAGSTLYINTFGWRDRRGRDV